LSFAFFGLEHALHPLPQGQILRRSPHNCGLAVGTLFLFPLLGHVGIRACCLDFSGQLLDNEVFQDIQAQ